MQSMILQLSREACASHANFECTLYKATTELGAAKLK